MQHYDDVIIPCSHCNLEFAKDVMISQNTYDNELFFCCKGCQSVYHILKDGHLDSFYDKLGSKQLHSVYHTQNDLSKFDTEGFAKKYISSQNGYCEISLIMDHIHCSACVWLNEKILHKTDGIIDATINYTTLKAKIVWNPDNIKLSQIIAKIQSIGYDAYAYDIKTGEAKANKARKDYYARLVVGIFCTMNIMWIAVAQYAGYFSGITQSAKTILNIAEFVLATPALFWTGWPYFRGAYFAFKNRIANMDTLIVFGTFSAYLYSIYATITCTGEVYFDSVTMVITFIFIGKYLEVLSKKNAVDSLDNISSSIPEHVTVIRDGKSSLVDTTQINIGDIIEVKAGEKIAIDGVVYKGNASFDESSTSGESVPVYKKHNDKILSGTVCLDSTIVYKATKDLSHSTIQSITSILEKSLSNKPKIEKLADSVSGYFSFVVLFISICTLIGWYLWGKSFEDALIIAISVTVIACPCALGLATPVATLVAVAVGSKRGILFKSASHLETIAKATTVVLDKTGTITKARPEVVNFTQIGDFDINMLYALVQKSNHPISKAIVKYLQANKQLSQEYQLADIKHIEARGLKANYKNHKLYGGNIEFINDMNINFCMRQDSSVFVFAVDNMVVCSFELEDMLKDGAVSAIRDIKKLGLNPIICSGDNPNAVAKIAKKVGIETFYSSMTPTDKADIITKLKEDKKVVIMVGDGINDTLALSKSDIAIAMGNDTDLAVQTSDVVLMDDQITTLVYSLRLSKKVFRVIKQNLLFSLGYNIFAIAVAVAGFVIPLVAAISMSISSLVVVGNSMRIKNG